VNPANLAFVKNKELFNDEMMVRSSIGLLVFVPPGHDEELLAAMGFQVIEKKDQTESVASVARSWFQARQSRADPCVASKLSRPSRDSNAFSTWPRVWLESDVCRGSLSPPDRRGMIIEKLSSGAPIGRQLRHARRS
jgi:hypothetical protein